MAKKIRTQAMRALDARKIYYKVHTFPDTIRSAVEVAEAIGMTPAQVFKTLVLLRDDAPDTHPFLVMIPADREIHLRRCAAALHLKSVRLAPHELAEKLTGLKVGGISALALLNRPFQVYLDESAASFTEILVSGGQRGVDLQLSVSDLLQLTQARLINVTQPKA